MKRFLPVFLIVCLLLCACSPAQGETEPSTQQQTQTTAPSTVVTEPVESTEPTTQPTEPETEPVAQYIHPLTGEALEEPMTARPFLVTINNARAALPLLGVGDADIVYEMLTNGYSTRLLAVLTDVSDIELIGAIRSLRYGFVDIARSMDGIVVHAGGNTPIIDYLKQSGVTNSNALNSGGGYFRDQNRLNAGYAKEHTLVAIPSVMVNYVQSRGIPVTTDGTRDYGMRFTKDGTPEGGATANVIAMSFFTGNKTTTMNYNASTGLYEFSQYGSTMVDGNTDKVISFRNVFTLYADTVNQDVYHVADLVGTGNGYYACGGKLVPIIWHHENPDAAFTYTLQDGTPLEQGVGTSYIGIIPTGSAFYYQ